MLNQLLVSPMRAFLHMIAFLQVAINVNHYSPEKNGTHDVTDLWHTIVSNLIHQHTLAFCALLAQKLAWLSMQPLM